MHHDASFFRALSVWTALSGLAAAGCYNPDIPTGRFKCDRPEDRCPSAMQCVAGVCQGRVDDPAAPAADDMAMPLPPPMTAKGCIGTGTLLAVAGDKDTYACSGSFPSPTSSPMMLCGAGYHVCNRTDQALFADARASGRCDSPTLGGFFAANVSIGYDASGKVICEPKVAVTTVALVGCGDEEGTRPVEPPCLDLVVAAPCNGTVTGWNCASGLATASHAAGKLGGVLCCKD